MKYDILRLSGYQQRFGRPVMMAAGNPAIKPVYILHRLHGDLLRIDMTVTVNN